MKNTKGFLSLILCAFCWSLGGVFLKYVNANSFAIAGIRSFVAFFGLLLLTRSFPKFTVRVTPPVTQNDFSQKENPHSQEKNCKSKIDVSSTICMWLGGIFYSLTMILYCLGNKMTTAANTTFLQYTAPIYVILLGPILLNEKNKWSDYLCVFGVIAGMFLFFADSFFSQKTGNFNKIRLWGNIIAVLSGITYALCTIFLRKVKGFKGASQNSFILAQLITFIFCIPFILKNGLPDKQSIIFLILLGILQMALPNALYAYGIKTVSALSAILITMIEPLMNPVWVAIFANEIPSATCIAGGIIILFFIVIREAINTRLSK